MSSSTTSASLTASASTNKAMTVFPPITPTAQSVKALPSSTTPTTQQSQQPFDPTQSLTSLLSSLSLPSLTSPPTTTSPLPSSTPSLFSCYLLSILHSTLTDLTHVLTLNPSSLNDPSLNSSPLLLIHLKDHFQLEHHHTLLSNALAQLSEGDEGYAHQLHSVQDQFNLIMDSTRALIRLLPSPSVPSSPPSPTSNPSTSFQSLFSHLVALITSRLHLSAKDATKQSSLLTSLTSQHSTDAALITSLTSQLAAARAKQGVVLSQQSALLSKYQTALSSLLDGAEEDVLNFNRRMKAEEEENERLYEAREAELVEEERRLREEWEAGLKEEWRVEAGVRRKVGLKEEEVQAIVDRYDAEMRWQEEVYADLSAVYEREREEARRLSLYFDRVRERTQRQEAELIALRQRRDEEVMEARAREECGRVLEKLYDLWFKKNGPKEKKKADKKKAYKVMWRPPREVEPDTAAADTEDTPAVE